VGVVKDGCLLYGEYIRVCRGSNQQGRLSQMLNNQVISLVKGIRLLRLIVDMSVGVKKM
jgi:hypothetical protein